MSMATQEKYQGWANYETWNVALWFANDRGLYDTIREHQERFTAKSAKEFVKELLPNGTPDFESRGKSRAYAKVDWKEIAHDFNEMRGGSETKETRHVRSQPRLDPFTRQYIETALWSSNDNVDDQGGEPLDKNYSADDISDETMALMVEDCAIFQERYADLLSESGMDDEQAGHDFWLSRNGHGTGFFDADIDEEFQEKLQGAAETFSEFNLDVGDDGKIYGPPVEWYREHRTGEAAVAGKRHIVADYPSVIDALEAAQQDGATHVLLPSAQDADTHVFFPSGSSFEKVKVFEKHGKWHVGARSTGKKSGFPRYSRPIGDAIFELRGSGRMTEQPDPTGEYAQIQRMMTAYAKKAGLGSYVANSAIPTGKAGRLWLFYAQKPGERSKPYEVAHKELVANYGRTGLSEATMVQDYIAVDPGGRIVGGPFKNYDSAKKSADEAGGYVQYTMNEAGMRATKRSTLQAFRPSKRTTDDRKAAWMRAFQDASHTLGAVGNLLWQDAEYLYHQGVDALAAAKRIYGPRTHEAAPVGLLAGSTRRSRRPAPRPVSARRRAR